MTTEAEEREEDGQEIIETDIVTSAPWRDGAASFVVTVGVEERDKESLQYFRVSAVSEAKNDDFVVTVSAPAGIVFHAIAKRDTPDEDAQDEQGDWDTEYDSDTDTPQFEFRLEPPETEEEPVAEPKGGEQEQEAGSTESAETATTSGIEDQAPQTTTAPTVDTGVVSGPASTTPPTDVTGSAAP